MPGREHAIRLSNHGYACLSYIAGHNKTGTLDIEEICTLNQLQMRSFKKRGYIVETADKRGIQITKEGRHALGSFTSTDAFFRTTPMPSFTALLNLKSLDQHIHKLKSNKPANVREMRKSG